MSRQGIRFVAGLVTVAAATAGCAALPQSGPVQVREAPTASQSAAPFDFDPPGPPEDATQFEIAVGFLRAMQATPPTTSTAADFLTAEAAAKWRPERRTVVYQGQRTRSAPQAITALLDGAFTLDSTGRWDGRPSGDDPKQLTLRLVREAGQWRITDPPNALIIPRSHFLTRYRPYSLYFFDPTGSVLVPELVYLPRGLQAPTRLVAGLLAGPPVRHRGVERSYLPAGASFTESVPVRADGVADVKLSEVGALDADSLERLVAQLAWTLRQVPQIESLQLTADGEPVDLGDGARTLEVSGWGEYDPALASASTDLFGVRGRAVVQVVAGEELMAASVPRGTERSRSLGVDLTGQRFALVSAGGREVTVLPREGADEGSAVSSYPASDLLRPMWDRTDRLWLVDRSPAGATVSVVGAGGNVRRLPAPGLRGVDVVAAALSRDGSRLAAVLGGPGDLRLVLSRVIRNGRGAPVRLTPARTVTTGQPLVDVRGVGWRDPASVAVLTRPSGTTTEVALAAVDGATGSVHVEPGIEILFDEGVWLASSPGGPHELVVATRAGRLHSVDDQGRWDLDAVPSSLRVPAFVG